MANTEAGYVPSGTYRNKAGAEIVVTGAWVSPRGVQSLGPGIFEAHQFDSLFGMTRFLTTKVGLDACGYSLVEADDAAL